MQPPNLFTAQAGPADHEVVEALLENNHVRIERIISNGIPSPAGFWYDQPAEEWVTLLKGTAAIRYDNGEVAQLLAGDHLRIPAHQKHRVEQVSTDAIWLAVHYG